METCLLESIPRLRWNENDHRFHYNLPIATEPGQNGFILLQEMDHLDISMAWKLPANERQHLNQMDKINRLLEEMEKAEHLHDLILHCEEKRQHHHSKNDEFHPHQQDFQNTNGSTSPRQLKKKDFHHQKCSPKKTFEAIKRTNHAKIGRVHQPK
jgi:hypothetical protein